MSMANNISAYNRKRKWELFMRLVAPTENMRILDVGFSDNEYSSADNYLEKHYPYPEKITALGVVAPVKFRERYPRVMAVQYDGNVFPFESKSFDVCWSNAVIEHVGDRDRQLFFLKEIQRVAGRAFITTPNRYFPVEVHTRLPFLHYLPKNWFDRCLHFLGKAWAAGNYMHLLSHSDLNRLLGKAGIPEYSIVRNRLAGFTMDFAVVF